MHGYDLPNASAEERDRWFESTRSGIARNVPPEYRAYLLGLAEAVESLYDRMEVESAAINSARKLAVSANRRIDTALEGSTQEESDADPFLSEEDALDPEYTARVDRVENETWAA